MIWNVYEYDFNAKKIKVFNIFDHYGFSESVRKLKKKKLTKEEFTKALKQELMYYFWSKYEHEVVVTTFPPHIDHDEFHRLAKEYNDYLYEHQVRPGYAPYINPEVGKKIDVYEQVYLNWDIFVDYVWGAIKNTSDKS